jgi:hypothetical protein
VLGTATLGAGFVVVASADAPEPLAQWAAAAVVAGDAGRDGIDHAVFAVKHDLSVEGFGTWPTLARGDAAPTALAPATFDDTAFVSGFLVATDDVFVTGFTSFGAEGVPGSIAIHNRRAGTTIYVDAPGNFAAADIADGGVTRVVVNGLGLGTFGSATGDAALFGLDDLVTPQPVELMGLGADQASSLIVVAGDVVYIGRFDLNTFTNQIFALPLEEILLAFNGTPPPLPSTPFVEVPVLLGAAAFGNELALVEGDAAFAADRVIVVPHSIDGAIVVAGEPRVVLDVNACTGPAFITSHGGDLFVGLSDDATGDRLLQVGREAAAP